MVKCARILLAQLFLLAGLKSNAQLPRYIFDIYKENRINPGHVKLIPAKDPVTVQGVYDFGESESEWKLVVIRVEDHLIIQTYSGHWGKSESGNDDWITDVATFDSVKLIDGRFRGKGIEGFFVNYTGTEINPGPGAIVCITNSKGVVVRDTAEFGCKSASHFKDVYFGKFPELSYELKGDEWFAGKDKETLQIMRNEIFARYGVRFAKGGKMHAYFSKQEWYKPQFNHVMDKLNEIERRNLAKILALENKQ